MGLGVALKKREIHHEKSKVGEPLRHGKNEGLRER